MICDLTKEVLRNEIKIKDDQIKDLQKQLASYKSIELKRGFNLSTYDANKMWKDKEDMNDIVEYIKDIRKQIYYLRSAIERLEKNPEYRIRGEHTDSNELDFDGDVINVISLTEER